MKKSVIQSRKPKERKSSEPLVPQNKSSQTLILCLRRSMSSIKHSNRSKIFILNIRNSQLWILVWQQEDQSRMTFILTNLSTEIISEEEIHW